MALTAEIPVTLTATLKLVTERGDETDVTPEQLEAMGYTNKRDLYRRLSRALALLATGDINADLTLDDEYEVANLIRYLIETGIFYENNAVNVVAHILPEEPELSLPQLRDTLVGKPLIVKA